MGRGLKFLLAVAVAWHDAGATRPLPPLSGRVSQLSLWAEVNDALFP